MKESTQPLADSVARARAFTLPELLVILAVIVFFACLHLKSSASSRGKTHTMICQANLRHLTLAWRMYADDNKEILAPAGTGTTLNDLQLPPWTGHYDGKTPVTGAWLNLPATDDVELLPKLDLRKSLLWPYAKDDLVFRCPADDSNGKVRFGPRSGEVVRRVRSMSMNSWIGGPAWQNSGAGWRVFQKLGDLVDPGPSRTFVFNDERADSINDGYFIVDMTGYPANPKTMVDFPAHWHNQGGNFSFGDGHVERWSWTDERTMPVYRGVGISLNVSQTGNPDISRMQRAATSRR